MKKDYTPIKFVIVIFMVMISVMYAQAQSILPHSATIVNNIVSHPRVFHSNTGFAKTSICGVDTVNYTFNKTTSFQSITLNASTSGNIFAQWYPAAGAITVSGFDFYAWQAAGSSAVVTLTCNIYNASSDSLPTGTPIRSITVAVDSSFGGGLLSVLRKKAIFSTPYTTSSPYVITIETSSSINVAVVANSWVASPPNGRSEWLSSVKIGSTFVRGYNVSIGSAQFNADFIFQPYVSFSFTAGFTAASCNAGGNSIFLNNTSSSVLFNRFYSVRAFQGIPQFSCIWDYGDSSGTYYTVNGTHTYNYRIPYTVKLLDTLYGWMVGCADRAQLTLSVAPPVPNANNNGPLCSGATLRLNADTISGASYYWTGPNGFTSSIQNPTISSVSISVIGTYSVRAIIGQCSSMVATTYVNVISTPSVTNNGPLCAGQSLNLSVTNISGASYSWTGPNSFTSSSQSPTKTGTTVADSGVYSVSVTLAGCGTIGPYTTAAVINRVPTTPTLTNNGPLCVGDNLNLTATQYSGGTYSWTGPNSFTSTQQNPTRASVFNSYAGTYTATISANGCTSGQGSTTVTINNVPSTPTAGNNGPLCSGQSLSLTATAISGAAYSWSGPNSFTSTSQNPSRTSLTTADAGNYSVIATLNGCASVAGVTYVAITTLTPTPIAGSNGPLCPGQNLQLSASTISGATYAWTGPNSFTSTQQNPSISNVSSTNAGIYSVTAITSGCGTSSSGNITLAINSLPSAPTSGNNGPVCNGDSLYLTASNITGATYFWSGPNGFTSSLQSPVILNMSSLKAGAYSVYVTVSGCGTSSSSSTTAITHSVPAAPTTISSISVCAGDSIALSGSASGVGSSATFRWTGPNSFNSTLTSPVLRNVNSTYGGTYNLTVSDSGCTSQPSTTFVGIKSIPASTTPTSNAPICAGANLFLYSTGITGATYLWKGPSGNYIAATQNCFIQNTTALINSGVYTVSSIVNGCTSIPASLTVVVNPLPATPGISNSGPKCIGDNITLSATYVPSATYSWSGPGGFSSSQQYPVLSNITTAMSGIYSVITISSSCTSVPASTAVIVNTFPLAPALTSNPSSGNTCSGDSMQLFVSTVTGATYDWQGPAGFGSTTQNPIIRNLSSANAGTYKASVTVGGCSSPQSNITIAVNQSPVTSAITGSNSVKRFSTQTYSVTGSPGSVFNWSVIGGSIQSGGTSNTVVVHWDSTKANALIKVIETSALGCNGSLVQQNVIVKSTIGIAENAMKMGSVSLFPNPASKILNVDFDLIHSANSKIEFVNMLGQSVLEFSKNVSSKDAIQLDISSLKTGMYFVSIVIGDEKKTMKITVE